MSRKNIITLLLSLGLLTLAGCNGNNAEQANNSNNAPIAVVEDTTIVLNERSYDLLTLPNSTTLPFKVYWPADVSLSDTDTKDVLDNFVVVNDVINSHFSISMAALAHKSIIFTPQVSETPSATQFSTIGPEQLQVTFSDHTRAFEGDFSQQILSFLYVSERIKKTADSSAFDRLITLGLTLHFLENSLTNATLPANTSLSATELLSALTQVKQAMADGKAHTDWFEDAGIAAPVGYYLAAQHFNYYPGGLMILDIFN